jgi:hypothetical protein
MDIGQLIGTYGTVGVAATLGVDLLVQKFNPDKYPFSNTERTLMVVLWPVMVLVIIAQFIKVYKQNK